MKIAAAINTDNENFFFHFGHAERFKMYEVENGVITGTGYEYCTGGHGPQRMQLMIDKGVNVIISDGQAAAMADIAAQHGIAVVAGATGDADTAVRAYLSGTLRHDEAGIHSCGICKHE